MRINEALDWLAVIFTETFKILEALGDGFNWVIIAVMFIMGIIWLKTMSDYNKEAAKNGTLK
jgi:uncharacterized membrane protein